MFFTKKLNMFCIFTKTQNMSSIDNQLINLIKSKSNKNISFIEDVALALEINYDAAYRRINGKTKLSLEDAITLSKYFKVSLNDLYLIGEESKIIVRKTTKIYNLKTLEHYFQVIHNKLKLVENSDKSSMYYSAKELPVFHLLYNTELVRFKIYVWLHILGKENRSKKQKFSDFVVPESLIETLLKVGKQYRNIRITEIWSSNIINTILHQIQYFYEANLLSYKSALNILKELKETLKQLEETTYNGKRSNANKTMFRLYHNQLLNSNNNVLVKIPNYKVLYMSFFVLRYYEIEDPIVCNNVETFLKEQMLLSKQITKSGTKDIILFFNPLYKQVDNLVKQINLLKQFPIQNF